MKKVTITTRYKTPSSYLIRVGGFVRSGVRSFFGSEQLRVSWDEMWGRWGVRLVTSVSTVTSSDARNITSRSALYALQPGNARWTPDKRMLHLAVREDATEYKQNWTSCRKFCVFSFELNLSQESRWNPSHKPRLYKQLSQRLLRDWPMLNPEVIVGTKTQYKGSIKMW